MEKEKLKTKLIHGDCLEVMKTMIENNIKVDLIVTDPPYDITINGGGSVNNIKKLNKSLNKGIGNANITNGFNYDYVFDLWNKLQENTNIYVWCNKKQIMIYLNEYVNKKKCTFDILFWNKNNALPTYSNKYLTDCEYLLHFRKGAKCKPKCYNDAKTVFLGSINYKDKKKYGHPAIKPLEFTEKIIRNSSKKGDIVLDCFMGSGTTGVACKNLNRNFIGIEINKEYFEIAKNRINS